MRACAFIDSNIFVYANDKYDTKKQLLAINFLESIPQNYKIFISTQVICEVFSALVKKLKVDSHSARDFVRGLEKLSVLAVNQKIIQSGIDFHILHRLSFWDGIIVASAAACSCQILFSEDLSAEQEYSGIKVVNPFV